MNPILPTIPHVIGHRGAAMYGPENTIAGIEEAAWRGVKMVEVDVRLTVDDQLVIFHDDLLDRTTNGVGPLDSALFDEVRRLDAGAWFGERWVGEKIPTLDEVIAATASLSLDLNIEIKSAPERAEETARIAMARAREIWPVDRAVPLISSFQFSALVVAQEMVPAWPRGLLLGRRNQRWREQAQEIDAASINIGHRDQDEASIATFRSFGKPVLCYTVNESERAAQLFEWGIDGVFSDAPDQIKPPVWRG